MPRFIHTLFLILVGNLAVLLCLFFFVPPQTPFLVLLFLGGLHLFISLLFSLIIFLASYKKYKKFNMPNKIFRRFFRRVFLIWALLFGIITLRIFSVYTVLSAVLFGLFVVTLYVLAELKAREKVHS